MSDNPAPGWYADPLRRYDHRYWDGTDWTEHVSRAGVRETDPLDATTTDAAVGATAGTTETAETARAGAAWPTPASAGGEWNPDWADQAGTGTTINPLAIVSLVLSLVWVGGLASLAGIITGVMARRQIRQSGGRETGDGAALAGIIIGGVGVALTLVAIIAMIAFFSIPTTPNVVR